MSTTSPVFTTTYDTGGSTKPAEAVYASPERLRTDEMLSGALGGDLNPVFIVDFLSAALMHEQCGRHLYRSIAGRTNNPVLKRRYEEFGGETEEHVAVLMELIAGIGGEPGYVSPSARATEKMDHGALEATFMLDGSLDLMTREMVMLDAVVVAETIDHANWEAITKLAEQVSDEHRQVFRQAVDRVLPQEEEHLGWATHMRSQMTMMQATRPLVAGLASSAEHAVEWIKGLFDDDGARDRSA